MKIAGLIGVARERTFSVTGVMLICIATCTTCDWLEMHDRYYSSYHDAVAAGEIQRGWLPEWIPSSSSQLRLRNDIDTGELWIEFSFLETDLKAASPGMRRLESQEIRRLQVWRAEEIRWWPEALRGDLERAFEKSGYHFYRVSRRGMRLQGEHGPPRRTYGYLAVSWAAQTAYYWENSRH